MKDTYNTFWKLERPLFIIPWIRVFSARFDYMRDYHKYVLYVRIFWKLFSLYEWKESKVK